MRFVRTVIDFSVPARPCCLGTVGSSLTGPLPTVGFALIWGVG